VALTCLLDTSVWNRLDRAPALAAEVTALLRHGEVGYSDIERLEVLRSARHTDHYWRLAAMFAALPKVALTEAALLRAGQVQEQLVQRGHHRGVKIPDLLITAAAEVAGVRVLHYDHDYDLISSITGQDVAWVVAKGSVS
jgi:predicted nucleic acid-binding protein